MKMVLVAVRDAKASVFSQPMFFQSLGQALRSFGDAVNDDKSEFAKHPEDYSLWHLGYYDDAVGVPEPLAEGPRHIVNGANEVKDG